MKHLLSFLVCVGFVLLAFGSSNNQPADKSRSSCNDQTARLIGLLYYVTNPVSEQRNFQAIGSFVNRYSQLLSSRSFLECARGCGDRLIAVGLRSFSPENAEYAYGRALEMGASMDEAYKVKSCINEGSIDDMRLGEELKWLARVIPEAAAGNWRPYTQTATQARGAIRQVWPLIEAYGDIDPSVWVILDQVTQEAQPWIVYYVASVVSLCG